MLAVVSNASSKPEVHGKPARKLIHPGTQIQTCTYAQTDGQFKNIMLSDPYSMGRAKKYQNVAETKSSGHWVTHVDLTCVVAVCIYSLNTSCGSHAMCTVLRCSVPVEWIFDVPGRWRGTTRAQTVPESVMHCLTCSRTPDSKPRMFVASSSSLPVEPSQSIRWQHIHHMVNNVVCFILYWHREWKCAKIYTKWHNKIFVLNCNQHFGNF